MAKQPMAFYHQKGLVPTWHLAHKYVGQDGRIATLPDIIDARLATEPGAAPWEKNFTSMSAEYVGIGRNGRKIIIVAHGVGPMATLDGILDAYRHEFGDKERNNRGGRISIEEFHKLEDGAYGPVIRLDEPSGDYRPDLHDTATAPVYVIDYERYVTQDDVVHAWDYQRHGRARMDLLLQARFDGRQRVQRVLNVHGRYAQQWHAEQADTEPDDPHGLNAAMGSQAHKTYQNRRWLAHKLGRTNPFLVKVADPANCTYEYSPRPEEQDSVALAHLLSISGLTHTYHEWFESLVYEVGAHEWWNGCHFVGVPAGAAMTSIHSGWDTWRLMMQHWQKLTVPLPQPAQIGLRPLVQLGDTWFTQYPSQGYAMETGEPEFVVTALEQIGEPVPFQTEIRGYHGFFRYDERDIRSIAPTDAGGYAISGQEVVWQDDTPTHHKAMVTFYRIKADTSQRLRRHADVEGDYETQMQLLSLL